MENKICKNCLNICECCQHKHTSKCEICKPFTSKFNLSRCNICNSKTKYSPGDRVRVRSDLSYDEYYYMNNRSTRNIVVGGMLDLAGKIVTIIDTSDRYGSDKLQYRIKEYACLWTDEMFECKVV